MSKSLESGTGNLVAFAGRKGYERKPFVETGFYHRMRLLGFGKEVIDDTGTIQEGAEIYLLFQTKYGAKKMRIVDVDGLGVEMEIRDKDQNEWGAVYGQTIGLDANLWSDDGRTTFTRITKEEWGS